MLLDTQWQVSELNGTTQIFLLNTILLICGCSQNCKACHILEIFTIKQITRCKTFTPNSNLDMCTAMTQACVKVMRNDTWDVAN